MGLWVPMTAMPQRIALSHAFGGLAAALVGVSEFLRHGEHLGTFKVAAPRDRGPPRRCSRSPAASSPSAKLQELVRGQPITYRGQNVVNLILFGSALVVFVCSSSAPAAHVALLRDVRPRASLRRAPRAADRGRGHARRDCAPELVRGPRSAATGFALGNNVLIIAGTLDGGSGFILSILMCKAMNRSITNVLFGAFGSGAPR